MQKRDCGRKIRGRGPESNDPPPADSKQHLELAEHQPALQLEEKRERAYAQGHNHVSNRIGSEARCCGPRSG